jgi:hypothetical protein
VQYYARISSLGLHLHQSATFMSPQKIDARFTPGIVVSSNEMLRLVPGAPRAPRIFAVILAIAAMLCVSVASASPAHTHLKDPADRCDICVTAHLTAHQVAVIQVVHALERQSFLAPPAAIQRTESRGILALLTRGPPSSL